MDTRNAVVTGASRGIGTYIARSLAERGMNLLLVARSEQDGLIAFGRVLRNDYRGTGVSASAIVLGAVRDTGIGQRTLDELGLQSSRAFMVGPEKVAKVVLRAIDRTGPRSWSCAGPAA